MNRILIYFLLSSFFIFFDCTTAVKTIYTQQTGQVFGTTYLIKYKSKNNYQTQFDSLFTAVNQSLSTYLPTSAISKINSGDTTVVVDDLFIEVFDKAKRIYKETDGYFDPTLAKLIDAYGFGSGKPQADLTEEKIRNLINETGFNKINIKNRKVFKTGANIQFNVNAFAKGFGLDVIARFLDSKNINNYLIEIGGEIRVKGKNERNKLWKIQIENPLKPTNREAFSYIELNNESMATSGNYRKFRITQDGKKIVHTINPKTGLATESNLLSVSVIAPIDCADVDAYATAFMAMGLQKTKDFLKKHVHLNAILIYENDKGVLTQYATNGVKELLY